MRDVLCAYRSADGQTLQGSADYDILRYIAPRVQFPVASNEMSIATVRIWLAYGEKWRPHCNMKEDFAKGKGAVVNQIPNVGKEVVMEPGIFRT